MRVILFLGFIVLCIGFVALRWHSTLQALNGIRTHGQQSVASWKGLVLGGVWLSNAIGLALSAVYFYDRDVSPFFWLMVVLAVNGLGILALYEFFPDLRRRRDD